MIVVRKNQLRELEKQRKRSNLNMLAAGILIGAAIGAIVALLMAPQGGDETRGQIKSGALSLGDKCKAWFGNGCCCCGDEDCDDESCEVHDEA